MGSLPDRGTSHPRPNSTADARSGIVILRGEELRALLTPARCLEALEVMYADLDDCPHDRGGSLGFETEDGKIHVKAGLTPRTHAYFAAKINANYPGNPGLFGLPTIQGLIVLTACDNGRPVAILQSGVLTGLRTAAATALAVKHGARGEARKLAIVGCGAQARYQAEAIAGVRSIEAITAFDRVGEQARGFASWAKEALGVAARSAGSLEDAIRGSDICVTCTTSTRAIVGAGMIPDGCFIAATGADNPDKQEIDPAVFAGARIIVDDIAQCSESGDLAHALRAGTVTADDVAATLAQLAAGTARGRVSDGEIVIFDSTGVGVQDVAASAAAYERALETGRGHFCELDP